MSDRLITEARAAEYLGIPRADLRDLREWGVVPTAGYVRIRTPLYDPDDLDDFVEREGPELGIGRVIHGKGESVVLIYDEEHTR